MLACPRPAESSRQPPIRAYFILQNEMRRLPARKCLESLPEEHTHALLVINGERFAAPGAQPEMFDAMAVRGGRSVPGNLLKPKKTSLAIIKIGRAFRMGAFQIHWPSIAAFLRGSHTQLKGKIHSTYCFVQLIKSIRGIGVHGASDMPLRMRWSGAMARREGCPIRPGRRGTDRPLQERHILLVEGFVEAVRIWTGSLSLFPPLHVDRLPALRVRSPSDIIIFRSESILQISLKTELEP